MRKYLIFTVLSAVIGIAAPAASAQPQAAKVVIEQFHDQLLGVMRDAKTLGFEGRRTRLGPTVDRTFDLPFMAQFATAGGWDGMKPQERDAIVQLFRRMTISTYASRFTGYSGQEFRTVEATETPNKDILVRTVLKNTGTDGDVAIDYLMRANDGAWRIVDVYLKRISELATRRSEYGSVIRREGVPALIASLEQRVRDIETGKAN
jgi:phospholipid transport system substrate-binding protein